MTPTLENMIVFTWLRLMHKDLPGLIKIKYGPELRTRTLASIKPEISAALVSLLDELGVHPTPVLRASTNPHGTYTRQQSSNSFAPRYNKSSQPAIRKPIVCSICKNAGRPHNHFLSS